MDGISFFSVFSDFSNKLAVNCELLPAVKCFTSALHSSCLKSTGGGWRNSACVKEGLWKLLCGIISQNPSSCADESMHYTLNNWSVVSFFRLFVRACGFKDSLLVFSSISVRANFRCFSSAQISVIFVFVCVFYFGVSNVFLYIYIWMKECIKLI